jgi:predicted PurR-regulated permease PerM
MIFAGIIFWGWRWGVAGALIAVPLLAVFKILCDNVDPLQPVGRLLGR